MSDEVVRFVQQTVNGLSISGVYALVALGITIQFGLTRLINFAQGAFVVLGSFLAASLYRSGLPFAAVLVLTSLLLAGLGGATERILFRATRHHVVAGFVVSLGLVVILESAMLRVWGGDLDRVSSPVHGTLDLSGVIVSTQRLLVVGVTLVGVLGFFALLRWTRLGRSMRAVAENPLAAELIGLHSARVTSQAFMLGGLLAGLGGVLLGILFPFSAHSGEMFVMKGFIVAIVGGLGSVSGAVVAALVLGMVETYGVAYIEPSWRDGFGFLVLVLVLLFRPSGLFRGTFDHAG